MCLGVEWIVLGWSLKVWQECLVHRTRSYSNSLVQKLVILVFFLTSVSRFPFRKWAKINFQWRTQLSIKLNYHVSSCLVLNWFISNEFPVSPPQLSCLNGLPRCLRTRRKLRKQPVTGSTRRFPFPISLKKYCWNFAAWLNNPQLHATTIYEYKWYEAGMKIRHHKAPILWFWSLRMRQVSQTLKNGFNSAANAVTKLHGALRFGLMFRPSWHRWGGRKGG